MADKNEQIRKGLQKFLGLDSNQVILATVVSVDKTAFTCHLKRANSFEIPDARLKTLKNAEKGIVMIPKQGSDVLVQDLGGCDWLVISMEEVEEMIIHANNTLIEIGKDLLQINSGENGAMLIAQSIVDRLNKLEQDNRKLKEAIRRWMVVPQDGGGALRTALTGALQGPVLPGTWAARNIDDTQLNDVINPKLKH